MSHEVRTFKFLVVITLAIAVLVLLGFSVLYQQGLAFTAGQLRWHVGMLAFLGLPLLYVATNESTLRIRYLFMTVFVTYAVGISLIYGPDLPDIYTVFFLIPAVAAMCQDARVYRYVFWVSFPAFVLIQFVPGIRPDLLPIPVALLRLLHFTACYLVVYTAIWYKRELEKMYQLSVAAQAAERKRALTDHLTGLHNIRFFNRYIDDRVGSGLPVSLVMLDLDGFKLVNDTYGHVAGDGVLQKVAGRIRSAVRLEDQIVRYGGDEFCILVPTAETDIVLTVADRCRDAICSRSYRVEGAGSVVLSASYGIASIPPGRTRLELVERADKNLYRAKREHRAPVLVSDDDPSRQHTS